MGFVQRVEDLMTTAPLSSSSYLRMSMSAINVSPSPVGTPLTNCSNFYRYKAEAQKKTRLNAERRQREAQKREAEAQNRKHLAGLRVIQKNLVYVVGLNPRIKEEDLLQTLRGELYFGQYGKIVKIVVNKRAGQDGMGVYVTFARKQDAATCIAAVDGSLNGDRVLRFVLTHSHNVEWCRLTVMDLKGNLWNN